MLMIYDASAWEFYIMLGVAVVAFVSIVGGGKK